MLRLSVSDTILDIHPDIGGALWRFTHKGRDVMRPTPDGATDALATASFPLVPFANRIRNGEFVLEGHKVTMPGNLGDSPHTLHGHGWRNAWRVVEASPSRAVLSYHHEPDTWPWEYEATIVYELRAEGLRSFLSVKNLSRGAMAGGVGFSSLFQPHAAGPDSRPISTACGFPTIRHCRATGMPGH
ncbi:MAG: hypothetical protein WDN06_13180 [Asticcacaulis sp.]